MKRRSVLSIGGLCAVALLTGSADAGRLAPRQDVMKPATTVVRQDRHYTHFISVKFRDDLPVRVRNGVLSDQGTNALRQAQPMLGLLAGGQWEPMHSLSEERLDALRQNGQARSGKALPDLNTMFHLYLPKGITADRACNLLNALQEVELAWPAPLPMPMPVPPDFEPQQNYLDPPTPGVDAECMWNVPGGAGINVAVCDLEYSWNFSHLDLPLVTLLGPPLVDPFLDDNHGTAVLGEIAGLDDGVGVTGICHDSTFFVAAANTAAGYNLAGAITTALGTLVQGDLILIEQQTAGPNWPGGTTQFGLVPSEWDFGVYTAIQTAVASGVTVVEAAGNGSQDLDDPVYLTAPHAPFVPANDSGAIIVGAGGPPGHPDGDRARLGFSCWGATVDLQAYGAWVVTTGYSDLYNAEGVNYWYTNSFSGTSSASPIVTGACADLQSAYFQATGSYLTPTQIRDALQATGSTQQGGTNPVTENIGPRPDAAGAFAFLYPAGDTNGNGVPDPCDPDCQPNGVPDDLDIANGTSQDCNNNGIPDECDITSGFSLDCQPDGIPDECQLGLNDCNNNGVPDECDIASGFSLDCNNNGIPDVCDIASGFSQDCQPDGIPDECQLGNCLNQYPVTGFDAVSDLDCDYCVGIIQLVADDFNTATGTTITGVKFAGFYNFDDAQFQDAFTINIWPDVGGLPGGAPIASFGPMLADLKLDTGTFAIANNQRIIEYTIQLPFSVAVGPGRYWIEIYNDTSGDPEVWRWVSAPPDPINGNLGIAASLVLPHSWGPFGVDQALQVLCTEPNNDCNCNGVPDECDPDCNGNGEPDDCETKPEFDPTLLDNPVPGYTCSNAVWICPDTYTGTTLPLAPTNSVLYCGIWFGNNKAWYMYRPTYDGMAFFGVTGLPLNWLFAVYEGCPGGPAQQVACNDVDWQDLQWYAEGGKTYYIAIAATAWSFGPYTATLIGPDCLPAENDVNGNQIPDICDCLPDVTNDCIVDGADILAVFNALGTSCAGCPEDINQDGQVDVLDYQIVLAEQGYVCPFCPPAPVPPPARVRQMDVATQGQLIRRPGSGEITLQGAGVDLTPAVQTPRKLKQSTTLER